MPRHAMQVLKMGMDEKRWQKFYFVPPARVEPAISWPRRAAC